MVIMELKDWKNIYEILRFVIDNKIYIHNKIIS